MYKTGRKISDRYLYNWSYVCIENEKHDITRFMITCDFQLRGSQSLTSYLYETIREQIVSGKIRKNEKLPSKRSLAAHLGVSVITVENTYSRLVSDGYVYSAEKRGFFASDDYTDVPEAVPMQGEEDLMHEIDGDDARSTADDASRVSSSYKQEITLAADFRRNSTGYSKFPFSVWSRVMKDILREPHQALLQSAPPEGVPALRKQIALYLRRFRDIRVDPSQIVIGAGTEYLYFMAVNLFGRNVKYAVENPGYRKIASVISLSGATCVPVDMDGEGLSVQKLRESGASVVHVSPSHHFPTGTIMSLDRRKSLLDWSQESVGQGMDRYILEDDYDSEFRFTGRPLETLFGASCRSNESGNGERNGRVIYINTFSKTLAPSYRISYMVVPEELMGSLREKLGFSACPVSVFEQYALARFMEEGSYEKHLIRMKNYYRILRNSLIEAIEDSPLALCSEIHEENSGLHFLLEIKADIPGSVLKQRFLAEGIDVPLLSEYFHDEKSRQGDRAVFVMNYSGVDKEKMPEAVRLMAKAVSTKM